MIHRMHSTLHSRYHQFGSRKQTQEATMTRGKHTDMKATKNPRTTQSQTQKNKAQQTFRRCTDNYIAMKEGSLCPRQHLWPCSLGEQQRARAVHIALTLSKANAQCPARSIKRRPRVTASKCTDALPLRVRTHSGTGSHRCPQALMLECTKSWPGCR
jgi:hypothetical protein